MRGGSVLAGLLAFVLVLVVAVGAGRPGGSRAQDATPDAEGAVTVETLGSGTPAAAPERTLGLYRVTLLPGGEVPRQAGAGALVVHVQSGEVGYTLFAGEAAVVRAGGEETEALDPEEETVLGAGDAVFEEGATRSVRNAGEGEAILLISGLTTAGEPVLDPGEGGEGVEDDEAAEDGSGAGADGGTATVSIVNFSFDPLELEVAAGTTVTWTNDDSAPHTVTADDGSFDSGTLQPGDSFSFTFEEAGAEVAYHCEIHPRMRGRVLVA